VATNYRKIIAIVTIEERIVRIKALETAQLTLIFVGNGPHANNVDQGTPERRYITGALPPWLWKGATGDRCPDI